jgi:tetratricopeptide (TPR) repeat protein
MRVLMTKQRQMLLAIACLITLAWSMSVLTEATSWVKWAAAQSGQEARDHTDDALESGCDFLANPEQEWATRIHYCEAWIALDPENAKPWYALGRIKCSQLVSNSVADYKQGLSDLLASVELTTPEDEKIWGFDRRREVALCAFFTDQEDLLALDQARWLVDNKLLESDDDYDKGLAFYIYFYTSFRADRYLESVEAFKYLEEHDRSELTEADRYRYAVALGVIGDYAGAARVFEDVLSKQPNNVNALEWLAVLRFGEQGWHGVESMWPNWRAGNIQQPFSPERRYLLPYFGLKQLGDLARRAGMPYVALNHYAKAFWALAATADVGDPIKPRAFHIWARASQSENANFLDAANDLVAALIDLYKTLPVKVVPNQEAIDYTKEGQRLIQKAATLDKISDQDIVLQDAAAAFARAVSSAPWWPEAHYNFALALGAWGITPRMAIREMWIFTNMSPNDSRVQLANSKIALWTERAKSTDDANATYLP